MPSFKPVELWDAEPHTLAKLQIVGRYLFLWFSILGRSHRKLVYIDGFAGPGKYRNSLQSSPLAALKSAETALDTFAPGIAPKISFRFIEPKFASLLKEVVGAVTWPPAFDIKVIPTEFEKYIDQALPKIRSMRKLPPVFTFIDPFGPTPVPFRVVRDLLSLPTAEVLLNLDSDGIDRLVAASAQNEKNLNRIFGDDSWRTGIEKGARRAKRCNDVLALYKRKLREIPAVRYVYPFTMNSRQGVVNYHLVFASQHRLGLTKMKEAMKAVDQDGSFSFSDDSVGQDILFREDGTRTYALRMQSELSGSYRPFSYFEDFALNETPFLTAKPLLKYLDDAGCLDIKWKGPRAKQGYPEERIEAILVHREPKEKLLFGDPG